MKILAFAGSNSAASINKKLAAYAASLFTGHDIEVLDLNDYEMPIYSPERQKEGGIHPLALAFAQKIDLADLLVVSLAEHNGAYAASFKNIYDWISRIKDRKSFGEKPVLLLTTSPGARGGATMMEIAKNNLPRNGGNVLETFMLPSFKDNFQDGVGIVNEALKAELEAKVAAVKGKLTQ